MIRIGTRGSKLALWQAYYIQDLLNAKGLQTEIVTFETKGDKILDVTLSKIGSKGLFTEELEEALRGGTIEIAVHSAKDLPSSLPDDLEIIAFTEREKTNDVLVSFNKSLKLTESADFVIGTSSTRRNALLKHYYPNIKTCDMRGNLQTRMKKLESGVCDAILLAFAGVHRMEMDENIVEYLDLEKFTPPVGQGTVAVEASVNLDANIRKSIIEATNNSETFTTLTAERAYLAQLDGGCSIPSFALAKIIDNELIINGGIVSLDGQKIVRKELKSDIQNPAQLGNSLAELVLNNGGAEILKEIRHNL